MEPSTEVREAYIQLMEAFSGGDAATWTACFSQQPGTLLLGNGGDEDFFAGPSAIGEMAQTMLPVLQRGGLTFYPGEPQAFREGGVGWVLDRRLTIRTTRGQAQELRATVIFRQEDGQWKVVLYTHAIGVPDEQVEVFRDLVWE